MDVSSSLPYPHLEHHSPRIQRNYLTTLDEIISHKFKKSISTATLPPSFPANNYKYIITTLRKTSGPRGKSGQPLDTPKRAAGALKAYMEDTAARLERGTHIHDSTTTSPHLHFFRAIAPTIIGYDDQPGGYSGNRLGIRGRDTGTQRPTRHAQTPSKEREEAVTDGNARPCLWHVVSLSPLRTRKGGQFTCLNPTCNLSHAVVRSVNIYTSGSYTIEVCIHTEVDGELWTLGTSSPKAGGQNQSSRILVRDWTVAV